MFKYAWKLVKKIVLVEQNTLINKTERKGRRSIPFLKLLLKRRSQKLILINSALKIFNMEQETLRINLISLHIPFMIV